MNDTLVSRAWVNDPIHDDVGPMEHHVIAPTLRGDGFSAVRFGSRMIRSPSISGGVTIAPRGFGGRFDCDGRPLASNVFLSRQRLQGCADELYAGRPPELLPRLNFDDDKLFSLLSLISAEAERPELHERLYIEQLVDLLCLQLLRAHSAFSAQGSHVPGGLQSRQVRRVTAYMLERLDEPVELQELADLLGLSRFHLCTAFRKATGRTPHQWFLSLRMRRARELLMEERISVTDVAMAVGYHTPSAFTYAFRSFFGVTPRELRRRL
jgi:AraC family transcriptional regulator